MQGRVVDPGIARQERWLKEGLARSRKGWNVTAQQTMLAEYDFSAIPDGQPNGQLFNMDQWDGYVAAHRHGVRRNLDLLPLRDGFQRPGRGREDGQPALPVRRRDLPRLREVRRYPGPR